VMPPPIETIVASIRSPTFASTTPSSFRSSSMLMDASPLAPTSMSATSGPMATMLPWTLCPVASRFALIDASNRAAKSSSGGSWLRSSFCRSSVTLSLSLTSYNFLNVAPNETAPTLLDRARAGDRDALEKLLTAHQQQIYRFGLKMCRDPEDAEDVLQDTLLAMARSVRDFRGASSISTWLYAITRNFCLRKRRKRKLEPSTTHSLESEAGAEATQMADSGKRPDEALAGREVETALAGAIDALAPKYREVLLLRDVEGLSAAETAEVLGIGVPAVKSRLHRARLAVRAQVAPVLGVPTGPAAGPDRECPDTVTLFSRYLEGEISPDVCAAMERHLETCVRCRSDCDSLRRTLALCRTSAAGVEVPDDVQASVRAALENLLARRV
jgi:RNA polymerase sigma-70 factor (ECF subfamily)